MFAPNSPLRALVTAQAGQGLAGTDVRRLLARIYECLPLICPRCGSQMQLIAFITRPDAIIPILTHLGEAITPPLLAPRARAPPECDTAEATILTIDQSTPWDAASAAPEVKFTFNQEAGA